MKKSVILLSSLLSFNAFALEISIGDDSFTIDNAEMTVEQQLDHQAFVDELASEGITMIDTSNLDKSIDDAVSNGGGFAIDAAVDEAISDRIAAEINEKMDIDWDAPELDGVDAVEIEGEIHDRPES